MRCGLLLLALAACGGKTPARHDAAPPPADAAAAHAQASPPVDAAPPRAERVEHVAWKLVDQRALAHREVAGEVVLDARDVGFARFTRFGLPAPRWRLGQDVGGTRAAIADRLASLEVPLLPEQAAATQITARVHADGKQAIAVKINGRAGGRLARVSLEPGWQTVALEVAPGRLIPGENELAFETRGGKTRAAFAWLRVGSSHPSAGEDPLAAATFDAAGDALELAEGAELAWYVAIPDGANLVGEVAGACRVEVAARAGDGTLAGGLIGGGKDRVDLSPVAGKVVRLALRGRDCPRARLVHPRITLYGPAPVALPASEPPHFIVVWRMQGLRADHLPVIAPGAHAAAPSFEELANASTVFRTFYASGGDEHPLAALGEPVRAAGFTEILVMNRRSAPLPAKTIVDTALRELDGHRDDKICLYITTSDCDLPAPASAGEVDAQRARYDVAITAQDAELGRFVHQLKAWGIWDQTMLIVTADFGEELAESGRWGHSGSLRDAVVHVPLVVHDPARFPGGTVVDEGAAAGALVPTVLAALGRPAPADATGAPLEPLAQGIGRGWPRAVYAGDDDPSFAVRIGRWKARVDRTAVLWLGDLDADPGETRDLAGAWPVERRMLADQLGLYLALRARWREASWGVTSNLTTEGAAALDQASTP